MFFRNWQKSKILLILFIILSSALSLAYADNIRIVVKKMDKNVLFVFYHPKDQFVSVSANKNIIRVTSNKPSEFVISTPELFSKFAGNFQHIDDGQTVSFSMLDGLEFSKIIEGENLVAAEMQFSKPKDYDLSKISAANNDPGSIKYSKQKEDYALSFNLGNNQSGLAAYMQDEYLWLVFDQKKNFNLKRLKAESKNSIFQSFTLVPSEDGTVIRIKLKENFGKYVQTNIVEKGWNISFHNRPREDNIAAKKSLFSFESLAEGGEGIVIKGDFINKKLIKFEDDVVGNLFSVLPTRDKQHRIDSAKIAIEFSVVSTLQGVVVKIASDNVEVTKDDTQVKIAINDQEDEEEQVEKLFPVPIDKYRSLPTLMPVKDKKIDILNFNQQKAMLTSKAAGSKDEVAYFNTNISLALFYFRHELYHEAVDVFYLLQSSCPELYEVNLRARFLHGVANTMIGDHNKAKKIFDELLKFTDVAMMEEVNLWSRYNTYSLGSMVGDIGVLPHMDEFMLYYSDDKYWAIVLASIELNLEANDLSNVQKLQGMLRPAVSNKHKEQLKFFQAMLQRKQNKPTLARQTLNSLILTAKDQFIKTRSAFELLKMRLNASEISFKEAIDKLEKLRFQWRGDQLEYQILLKLAKMYYENDDVLNSLRTYQYIQSAFNNKVSNFYITSEMARIFNDVFLEGGKSESMDDFTVVSLFYEFKELNPIGEQGDEVILSIARRLVHLDLLETAADLLRHQIKYRLKGNKRVANADNLVIILMMDNKPKEAIFVLDETDKDNFSYNEHQYRLRLRARALVELANYDQARAILIQDEGPDALVIKKEVIFRQENWQEYIDFMQDDISNLLNESKNSDAAKQDILRLAISYYKLDRQSDLKDLVARMDDSDKKLKNTIELLITSVNPIDYKDLDKSLNIDQMENMLNQYKNGFLQNNSK